MPYLVRILGEDRKYGFVLGDGFVLFAIFIFVLAGLAEIGGGVYGLALATGI